MYAQQFALLEAKVRDIAILVTQLREEKRRLQQENTRLRERVAELEEELQDAYTDDGPRESDLERLWRQLESLQQDDDEAAMQPGPMPIPQRASKPPDTAVPESTDPIHVGTFYEQQGQFEEAINVYQHILDRDVDNLEATHRLATLLEKLNRNTEAARLWQKIWQMHQAKTPTKRRWLR
jgi:tetratricopeptide (TPR) repeat protein